MLEILVAGAIAAAIPVTGWIVTTLIKILQNTSITTVTVQRHEKLHIEYAEQHQDHEIRLTKIEGVIDGKREV